MQYVSEVVSIARLCVRWAGFRVHLADARTMQMRKFLPP